MTRPLIRKVGKWWWIFVGRTDYHLGGYYTTNTAAHNAAVRLAGKRNAWH